MLSVYCEKFGFNAGGKIFSVKREANLVLTDYNCKLEA